MAAQAQNLEFFVDMTCQHCKNAVTKTLGNMEGITNLNVDQPNKKVTLSTAADPNSIVEALTPWAEKNKKQAVRFVGTF